MLVYENESNEEKNYFESSFYFLLLIFVVSEQFRVVCV